MNSVPPNYKQKQRKFEKMDAFEESKNDMSIWIFFSRSSTTIFLHSFSTSSHLILLLVLSVSWACKTRTRPTLENSKPMLKNTFLFYSLTLISCMGLSFCNLLLCILNYLSGCKHGWSDLRFIVQLDFILRTLTWFLISIYLHNHFSYSSKHRFPILLRIWCAFHFLTSCFYLVIHLGLYWKHLSLPFLLWISDAVSIIASLLFFYAGLFGKGQEDEDFHFLEPLLKTNASQNNQDDGQRSSVGGESVTPYANANLLSTFTFAWIAPLLALGHKKTLDLEDVPQLAHCDSTNSVFSCFRNNLGYDSNCYGNGGQVSIQKLVKALIFSTWNEILWTAIFSIVSTLASYVGPYFIDVFVQYLNNPHQLKYKGYVLVFIFFLSKLIRCFSERHLFFQLRKMAIRIRAALLVIIYKKGLRLSSQSKQGHTSGENINLMSVDVERIAFFSWYLQNIWRVPIQVVLALLILYRSLGLASLAAFFATMILMLANVPLGKLQEKFQGELMDSKDKRMKVTSEALRNMKILKLQGWEMKFLAKIIELRNFETKWLKKLLYTSVINAFVFFSVPMFVSMITFGFCILMEIPLESGKILSALATIEILQVPIYNLPDTISMVVQTKVSLDRMTSFLCLDDLHLNIAQKLPRDSAEVAIEIVKGNFSWYLHSPNLTLKDINFRVYCGMKVAICGSIGSGKSSLLSCILGEMPKLSGAIKLNGTKAYVAQSPWIQSGKILDNILFGKEMDKEKYEMILEACSLKKDLDLCAFGDQTIIGERGVNLSGGQKQRIQIARALYHDADIYLLDDPFSAVDAQTGTHLYQKCLLGILESKTVIYVTHQVEFLSSADLILVMRDGRITQAGKYKEILSSGTDFMELIGAHRKALAKINSIEHGATLDNLINGGEDDNMLCNDKSIQDDEERELKSYKTKKLVRSEGQLVQEEKREKGGVSLSVYWKYVTATYKGAFVPLILLLQILFQLLVIVSSYWMVLATPVSEDRNPYVRGSTLIFVYVALILGSSLCVLIRSMLFVTAGYKTATLFFNKMHLSIFRAPLSFFDSTPNGRILNRVSIDQSAVDTLIPHQIEELLVSIIEFLGTTAVMSQIAWQMLIVFIPMTMTCIWYQQYYLSAARELSRLIGVCQAPIIQHFTESCLGSTTIRCFDQEEKFMDANAKLVDEYSRPIFHFSGAMEWLCFRMDMLASITYVVSLVFLISLPKGVLSPGIMGLAVTYGLGFSMHAIVWDLCSLENKIISVERILQYTCIPSESPLLVEDKRPGYDWPSQGKIEIVNLQVQYAPHLPLVLRGITCTFPKGMKIGIVGRTGSGKSTLIQALFRMLEPTAGQIWIDSINISEIGLHDLRSRLSIIPQDPIMFEGTLRSNLDPLKEYTDDQIWEALDRCHLGDEVRKKEEKLDFTVNENGENWSMGQRQLICLGRVLLKRSKVLVLDEATASVDTATDYLIQQTLRQHFSESTVITIAHRITSILDIEKVLLLDNGSVLEYDSPTKLLEIKSSQFARLVKEYTRRCYFEYEKILLGEDGRIDIETTCSHLSWNYHSLVSQAENAFSQYWAEHIGLPHPPHWLAAKASPLNHHQTTMFMKLMEENDLASHLQSFCKQANIACSRNALMKKKMDNTTLPKIAQWNAIKLTYDLPNETPLLVASQGGLPYFRESMVKEGGFMLVPDLRDPMSYKSFLPRLLVSKIPFSSAHIKELKKLFGVVDELEMDEYIQKTLKICEKRPIQGEQCTCVTSAEDLIDFVVEKLGHHVCVWSTESIEGSYENVTIGAMKLIHDNLYEPPALCHSLPFPFQVYYCHVLQKVKLYAVDIHARKKVNHAIMACHHDTSTWNSNHLAFKLLGFGPGLIEVCHWMNENGVVWTKTLS